MHNRLWNWWFWFVVMPIGACGGSQSGGTQSIPESSFASVFANSMCTSMASCCSAHQFSYDRTACERLVTAEAQAELASLDGTKERYDGAAAKSCLDALTTDFRACARSPATDARCELILAGTLAPGAACQFDEECAARPDQTGRCSGGTCILEVRGKLGDPCVMTCTADAFGGKACTGSAVSFAGAPSYAGAPGAAGAGSGTGGAGGSASNVGPLTSVALCYTNDNLECGYPSGTCVALPGVGQACPDLACAQGAFCDNGTCVSQQNTGPCVDARTCSASAYCDSTRLECLPKKPNGAACDMNNIGECASGGCVQGICGALVPVTQDECAGIPSN